MRSSKITQAGSRPSEGPMATLIFPVILAPQFGFTILRVPASVISLFLAHKRKTDVHLIVSDACAEGRPGVGARCPNVLW